MKKVLIADDESVSRRELTYLLEQHAQDIEVVEARNGAEALAAVEREQPDVAFLDVQMPEVDGLEAARRILDQPQPPLIVFATAFGRYAVDAFDLEAADYVVKPFDEERVGRTVERVSNLLADRDRREARTTALRAQLAAGEGHSRLHRKLWGERPNGSKVPVDTRDIQWLAAERKQVFAYTANETLRVRATLKDLEERLADHGFVRIHKAYLANLDHVAEVAPWFSGSFRVGFKGPRNDRLIMSRRYARKVKELTGW